MKVVGFSAIIMSILLLTGCQDKSLETKGNASLGTSGSKIIVSFFDTANSSSVTRDNELNIQLVSLANERLDFKIHGAEYNNIAKFTNQLNPRENIINIPYFRSGGVHVLTSNEKKVSGIIAGYKLIGEYDKQLKNRLNALLVVYPKYYKPLKLPYMITALRDDDFSKNVINILFLNTLKTNVKIEYTCGLLSESRLISAAEQIHISCPMSKIFTALSLNGKNIDSNLLPKINAYAVIHSNGYRTK